MGIVIRQSFYSSISAYIGVGIGYLNAIILMPLFMTPDEIGLMRAVMSIALLASTLSVFGMDAVLIKYFPEHGSSSRALNRLFSLGLTISLVVFLIMFVSSLFFSNAFFAFFEEKSPEIGKYLGLIILLVFQMTLFRLIEAVSIVNKQIILPNLVRDLVYKVLHTIIILVYGFELVNYDKYLKAHGCIYLLLILAISIPFFRDHKVTLDFSILSNRKELAKILSYGGVVILSGLGMTIIIQVDQIMVTKYLGLSDNGIYSIALFMAMVIDLPRRFLSQISGPIISNAFARKDLDEIEQHYKKASINALILGLMIFLMIMINLDNIYSIMPNGDYYRPGWIAFFIFSMVKLIDMGFSLNGEIIGYSKYFRFNLYSIIVLCFLAIVSNYILIPLYGLAGAAGATFISFLIFNLVKFLFIKNRFGFTPFSKETPVIITLTAILLIANMMVPQLINPFIDLALRSILTIGIFILAAFKLKVSVLFNDMILALIRRIASNTPMF